MFAGMKAAQKLGVVGLAVLGLGATGVVGAKYLNKPAPIEMTSGVVAGEREAVVHVTGAVKKPDLYTLRTSQRVNDAIKAAGGATEDANLEGINLAQHLVDGMQISVASKSGDSPGGITIPNTSSKSTSSSKSTAAAPGAMISINSADATQLDELPGVGPATARAIIEYRTAHGGFKTVDELMEVKGIGPKKLEKMRPFVRL